MSQSSMSHNFCKGANYENTVSLVLCSSSAELYQFRLNNCVSCRRLLIKAALFASTPFALDYLIQVSGTRENPRKSRNGTRKADHIAFGVPNILPVSEENHWLRLSFMQHVNLAIYPYDNYHSQFKSGQDVDFLRHMFSSYAFQSMAGSKFELNAINVRNLDEL